MPEIPAPERFREYRATATRCLQFAAEATVPQSRIYWLNQAQFWHELATQLERGQIDSDQRLAVLVPGPQPHDHGSTEQ